MGGYCLTKDTKQMLASYQTIPQNIISSIVDSNSTRKDFLADVIIKQQPKTVGVYGLTMKAGSDNFRNSAVLGVIQKLMQNNLEILIYEPAHQGRNFENIPVTQDFKYFEKFKLCSEQALISFRNPKPAC